MTPRTRQALQDEGLAISFIRDGQVRELTARLAFGSETIDRLLMLGLVRRAGEFLEVVS